MSAKAPQLPPEVKPPAPPAPPLPRVTREAEWPPPPPGPAACCTCTTEPPATPVRDAWREFKGAVLAAVKRRLRR
jgi:hypothetical protein